VTLAFRDPAEEAGYLEHLFASSLARVRRAIACGLAVLPAFGYIDYRLSPAHYHVLWMSRGACAAGLALGLALSYTSHFRSLMQPVIASGAVLCGALTVWLIYLTRDDRFSGQLQVGILVCVMFACMVLRLRFVWAAGSCVVMLGLFLAGARPYLPSDDALFVAATSLSLATVSSALGAYTIEVGLRHSFWQARQLERADRHYQQLLHSILPEPITARLDGGDDVIAEDKHVSVVFADLVGSVQSAEPCVILVTREAADAMGSDYRFAGPFSISVKGKGTMSVYHLLARRRDPGPPS
jgi:hypothetical protein